MFRGPATVLGFGELGTCLVQLLREHDVPTHIWRRAQAVGADEVRNRARDLGAELHSDLAAAVAPSALVLSCVPGSVSLAVASAAAPHLTPDTLFVDAASALPEDKQRAEERIVAAGATYVDAAVLGSVAALGAKVPWLIAGPTADRFGSMATALGMHITVLRAPVGGAARVKMLRSVYLKGRDALVTEMALAAHAYGVLPEVIASIGGPAEQVEFPALAQRLLRSTAKHAVRRADELEAAARVLQAAGVAPLAVEGSVRRLRSIASDDHVRDQGRSVTADLTALADEIS